MRKTLLVWTSTPHIQHLVVSRHRCKLAYQLELSEPFLNLQFRYHMYPVSVSFVSSQVVQLPRGPCYVSPVPVFYIEIHWAFGSGHSSSGNGPRRVSRRC